MRRHYRDQGVRRGEEHHADRRFVDVSLNDPSHPLGMTASARVSPPLPVLSV
jgi:hypothetical protein